MLLEGFGHQGIHNIINGCTWGPDGWLYGGHGGTSNGRIGPPGMPGAKVIVRHRLGADALRIITASGATVAVHRRAPNGAGATVRDDGHVRALETTVLQAFSNGRPCRSKTRRPAGDASRAEAARLRGTPAASSAERVMIDLSAYAALVPAAARATASTTTTTGLTQLGGLEQ